MQSGYSKESLAMLWNKQNNSTHRIHSFLPQRLHNRFGTKSSSATDCTNFRPFMTHSNSPHTDFQATGFLLLRIITRTIKYHFVSQTKQLWKFRHGYLNQVLSNVKKIIIITFSNTGIQSYMQHRGTGLLAGWANKTLQISCQGTQHQRNTDSQEKSVTGYSVHRPYSPLALPLLLLLGRVKGRLALFSSVFLFVWVLAKTLLKDLRNAIFNQLMNLYISGRNVYCL